MSIGTAKPSKEELQQAEHYLINSHSINFSVSAGKYEKIGLDLIKRLHQKHDVVIVTGGSGMFIDALSEGLNELPSNESLRMELNKLYESEGVSALKDRLQKLDSIYFKKVDQQNHRRLIRAIELIETTGKKMAELQQPKPKQRPFSISYLALDLPREELYKCINQRVDEMMEAGLLEEVKGLLPYQQLTSLNTIGYAELFQYLNGNLELNDAVELIKRNSRRYAKRQLTWFKRTDKYKWFNPVDKNEIINWIEQKIQ